MITPQNKRIRLGISTCPNDTFAFAALMEQRVDWRGLEFDVLLGDIEQLNQRLQQGELDVGKASFHAALWLADRYSVLRCGAALGYGVGPLLLAAKPGMVPLAEANDHSQATWLPGPRTTASLLFQLFYPRSTRMEHVVFSDIMPGLRDGRASFGVCIHEGRFTYQQFGLILVEDLGNRWENETGLPLPLGGILASRSLSDDVRRRVADVIADSLQYAWDHPGFALPVMRRYALEFSDSVLMQHVELYVNARTLDLGLDGEAALKELARRAIDCGCLPERQTHLHLIR